MSIKETAIANNVSQVVEPYPVAKEAKYHELCRMSYPRMYVDRKQINETEICTSIADEAFEYVCQYVEDIVLRGCQVI